MKSGKVKREIEIMAPAGSWESLRAALQAEADSVYFGVEQLNMRIRGAKNFKLDELPEIVKACHEGHARAYLTVNTLVYDEELELNEKILDAAKNAKVDAVIAFDMATILAARKKGLRVHASTQLNISNIEAVEFFSQYVDVVVLARELSLEQIKKIVNGIEQKKIKGPCGELVKVEVFIHGALCVAIAGRCYMSLATYNHAANRGDCFQNCRRTYLVKDKETGEELEIDNQYVMSPKDLCTIGFLDKLLDAGVSVLKIEGRARAADYVFTVTKCYKEAVQSYLNGTYNQRKVKEWLKQLESAFNRGFWQGGYYLGKPLEMWAKAKGSKASVEKVQLGVVRHFFSKKKIAVIDITSEGIAKGDKISIIGPTSGILEIEVPEIYQYGRPAKGRVLGKDITILLKERVRGGDKLFLLKKKV
jgi:putative protease